MVVEKPLCRRLRCIFALDYASLYSLFCRYCTWEMYTIDREPMLSILSVRFYRVDSLQMIGASV